MIQSPADLVVNTTSQLLLAKAMQGQTPADVAIQEQQHCQLPPESSGVGPFDPTNCRALYIGNLHPYMTENHLHNLFSTLGAVSETKIIKDKATGMSAGYGFVNFLDHG